ncbi:MAG: 50S ribosomal protein L23 [Clostridia bacterium]|nr:50S ribosomal protein L23 [Clostridia bacterium]
MRTPYDVIKKPVISEKSMMKMQNDKTYVFEVATDSNKTEVKSAVEAIFDVKVAKVTIVNVSGKEKRMGVHKGYRPDTKKAYVKLTEDSKTIEFFDGMM